MLFSFFIYLKGGISLLITEPIGFHQVSTSCHFGTSNPYPQTQPLAPGGPCADPFWNLQHWKLIPNVIPSKHQSFSRQSQQELNEWGDLYFCKSCLSLLNDQPIFLIFQSQV